MLLCSFTLKNDEILNHKYFKNFNYVGPEDIYECNLKLILGLVWTLISRYQIRSKGRGLTTKQGIKEWLQTLIPEYPTDNFNTDWNDGRRVCGLVDRLKPGACPNHLSLNPADGLKNCQLGMSLALEHFDIPMILDPEDLNNPDVDDLSVMTYISYFFEPAKEQLLQWLQSKLPHRNITNVSKDWNDGTNLAALMNACHDGLFPDYEKLDPHNALENVEKCLSLAKSRLDIDCPVSAKDFTDPDIDEIVTSTYLSRFKYSEVLSVASDLAISPPSSDNGACIVNEPMRVPTAMGFNPQQTKENLEVTAKTPDGDTIAMVIDTSDLSDTVAKMTPTIPGEYVIEATFQGDPIKGSPLTTVVIDPKQWKLTPSPPNFLSVNKPHIMAVEGEAYGGSPAVLCEVTNSRGYPADHIEAEVEKDGENKYKVSLIPTDIGEADVKVSVAGKNIPKSPFQVNVCDPTKCKVSGIDTDEPVFVGDEIAFTIDAEDAGATEPQVDTHGPKKAYKPAVEKDGNGLYNVAFAPAEAGDCIIDVVFGGEHVDGSPFKVIVVDPTKWEITPPIPEFLQVNEQLELELVGTHGSPDLECTVTDLSNNKAAAFVESLVDEINDGKYFISLMSSELGKVEVAVTVSGKNVKRSPFSLTFCDTKQCSVDGFKDDGYLIGEPIEFTIDTEGAGDDHPRVEPSGPTAHYKPDIIDTGNGKYSVSFTPKEVGVHDISVVFGGTDIKGSPFKVAVTDPSAWKITSEIPKYLHIGEVHKLEVTGSTITSEKPVHKVTTTSGEPTDILAASFGQNISNPSQWILTLVPSSVGTVQIGITFGDKHIEESPFNIAICDTSKCKVKGLEGDTVKLGEPLEFTLDTVNAGDMTPEVKITGASATYNPEIRENDDRLQTLAFTPFELGKLTIAILYGGKHVPGSPFEKSVESMPDISSCSARGSGLHNAVAEYPARFTIITPERDLLNKPGALSVDILSVTGKTRIEATIEDNKDMTYGVTYIAPHEGKFLVDVKFHGRSIPGSEFVVDVIPRPDAAKCRIHGASLHPNALLISGQPLEFYVDTQAAGKGELQVVVQGPKKTSPKVFMAEMEGEYTLRVDTKLPGWYRINVWWSNVHIPKSPVDLRIYRAPDASKVHAFGPGLGPQIEVHKPAEFTILTREAGIGTLTVVVHGVKDAFRVKVQPEDQKDPRTLKGVYYPREAGEYNVTIKWSDVEIPQSPFPVRVIDPTEQTEEVKSQKGSKKKKKRGGTPEVKFVPLTFNPMLSGGRYMDPRMRGYMMPQPMVKTRKVMETRHQAVRQQSAQSLQVTSARQSTDKQSQGKMVRHNTAPIMPAPPSQPILKKSKSNASIEAAMQRNLEKMGDITPVSGSLRTGVPVGWSKEAALASNEPICEEGAHQVNEVDLTRPIKEEEEESIERKPSYHTFRDGDIPEEMPVTYQPVYIATGDTPQEKPPEAAKTKKHKKKKKKKSKKELE